MSLKTADSLAREHTAKAISTLAEVMDDTFAENRDRIRAAEAILDRGHGKPSQAIIAVPGNRQMAALLASKTDDELMELISNTSLPRLAPIDAQFSEVPNAHDPLLD